MIYSFNKVADYLTVLIEIRNRTKALPSSIVFVADDVEDMLDVYDIPVGLDKCQECGHLEVRYISDEPENRGDTAIGCSECCGLQKRVVGVDMVIQDRYVTYWRN